MFMPGIFVEHDVAAQEWKKLKSSRTTVSNASARPKVTTIILLLAVCFLTRVNINVNDR